MEKMVKANNYYSFFKNKKVFVTGHTGFKGTWICHLLLEFGAEIMGYALEPESDLSLFVLSDISKKIRSTYGDIRDKSHLEQIFNDFQPEIVIHLAAQPLVRESYLFPSETYEVNVMGTINLLECIRKNDCVKSFLNVTTDKVYENLEFERGYNENDRLNGNDPYSNSKSCSELVTSCYIKSFLKEKGVACSTARAGNVIGGGDNSKDRIIPDCIRAGIQKENIIVRNPQSIRPYQHVLEPLSAYLKIVKEQYIDINKSDSYNIGPSDECFLTTGELVTIFCKSWGSNIKWIDGSSAGPKEANILKLDSSKINNELLWHQKLNIHKAVDLTVDFTRQYLNGMQIADIIKSQIAEYLSYED